jgi:hypothetical protein
MLTPCNFFSPRLLMTFSYAHLISPARLREYEYRSLANKGCNPTLYSPRDEIRVLI